MSGWTAPLLTTASQSIPVAAAACCGVPRSRMGGLPLTGPVCPLYPGTVGTATPATVSACPHPSSPVSVPALPFFRRPLRLVQPARTFTLVACHTAN